LELGKQAPIFLIEARVATGGAPILLAVNEKRYLLVGGIAAWLAVWVVLFVASDLNPTLRSWLLVIVAIPAVWQFSLLILDTSLVKGWRADRREKKRLRQARRPRSGADIDVRPDGRIEVWWWLPLANRHNPWPCSVVLRHCGREARWEGEATKYPLSAVAYPDDFTGSIDPISHQLWHWVEVQVSVLDHFDGFYHVWINRRGLRRHSYWAKLRSRISELIEKGDPPPPYGVG